MENEFKPGEILTLISRDIRRMQIAKVNPENIRISIPNFWLSALEAYNRLQAANYKGETTAIFGHKIVEGYNNQICVFDTMATPDSIQLEPIKIKQ